MTAVVARDLMELIRIRSVGGTPGEEEAQHWVAARLAALGVQLRTWRTPIAQLRHRPDYPGMEVERESVTGLLGRIQGTGTETVLLVAHTDVVPDAGWSDAFTPTLDLGDGTDGHVTGRGAADMKGGVAAMVHVARLVAASGRKPARTIALAAVSAEEDGGVGTVDLVSHLDDLPGACVVPEPTGGEIVVANAGALGFTITVHGRSAHAARRWEGIDALDLVVAVRTALAELEAAGTRRADPLLRRWPVPHPTSIGVIEGGDWASTVMPSATLQGRYGVPLDQAVDQARRGLEHAVRAAVARVDPAAGVDIRWEGGQFAPVRQDPDASFVRRLSRAHEQVTGSPGRITGTTYGSDMRLLVAAGIPTALYGPGEARQAHAQGERVAVADVVAVAEALYAWASADG